MKPMVTKEISSGKTRESFLRHCFVMSVFISQRYTFHYIEQFANSVFVESAMGYSVGIESYGEKLNIRRLKLERSLLRNCFVMCDSSHRVTLLL